MSFRHNDVEIPHVPSFNRIKSTFGDVAGRSKPKERKLKTGDLELTRLSKDRAPEYTLKLDPKNGNRVIKPNDKNQRHERKQQVRARRTERPEKTSGLLQPSLKDAREELHRKALLKKLEEFKQVGKVNGGTISTNNVTTTTATPDDGAPSATKLWLSGRLPHSKLRAAHEERRKEALRQIEMNRAEREERRKRALEAAAC